ncbi:integrase core domain-containing protein [Corynebacterium sp.]|uniref:integrase core domain-containing protein n=1 Tax=Corynebacterium sp. TaxID=1720 RepID=UPI0026DC60D6|nr:integrase core domain-containing protein [Corynebacterium sp.]
MSTALYKNELINAHRWADAVEVEIATFQWVTWWNETRLHENLGYRTPVEVEAEYWITNRQQEIMGNKANA